MEFSKISDILVCPICHEISSTPIYQCGKGHIICHSCLPQLKDKLCPTCRSKLPNQNIRVLALEQLANSIEVKCKNWGSGCRTQNGLEEINAHLKDKCRYENVNWCEKFGGVCTSLTCIMGIQDHFLSTHDSSTLTLLDTNNFVLEISQTVNLKDVLSNLVWEPFHVITQAAKTKQTFIIHSEFDPVDKLFKWTVINLMMPPEQTDSKGGLKMEFSSNDDDNSHKTTWQGQCMSFEDFIEQDGSRWNPKFTCCQPLGAFAFTSSATGTEDMKCIHFQISFKIESVQIEEKSEESVHVVELLNYQKVGKGHSKNLFQNRCSLCSKSPIKGVIYSCTKCEDFDLCGDCTSAGLHDDHILIRKKFPEHPVEVPDSSGEGVLHGRIRCDGCGRRIRGVRYKCCCCLDLDICEECEGKGFHDFHWCVRITKHHYKSLKKALSSIPNNPFDRFQTVAESRGYERDEESDESSEEESRMPRNVMAF